MIETDDRVHGIIFRAPGVADQPFCMRHKNGLYFGQGNVTYRFPAAPINRHIMKYKGLYIWHIEWVSARYSGGYRG